MVRVIFRLPDGRDLAVEADEGGTVLEAARKADIAVEGACGGSMACATCHVILDDADFDRLPPPSPEEDDMLDLAQDVTDTSRLGCQIRLRPDLDGLRLFVPKSTLLDG
ncbi:MAG: 2Fe-2S iron-sulfur cluster binding domain-containing protein [Geminicoccaceae bacterium]|nr:2Fe-2S iron-sulfur cluster binding domain-containing protein [Geminicoccaceae bacterium]